MLAGANLLVAAGGSFASIDNDIASSTVYLGTGATYAVKRTLSAAQLSSLLRSFEVSHVHNSSDHGGCDIPLSDVDDAGRDVFGRGHAVYHSRHWLLRYSHYRKGARFELPGQKCHSIACAQISVLSGATSWMKDGITLSGGSYQIAAGGTLALGDATIVRLNSRD